MLQCLGDELVHWDVRLDNGCFRGSIHGQNMVELAGVDGIISIAVGVSGAVGGTMIQPEWLLLRVELLHTLCDFGDDSIVSVHGCVREPEGLGVRGNDESIRGKDRKLR